jgi:hypothetical protein
LDVLTLFFLYKFTKKPLRFFGLVGSAILGAGAIVTGYLGVSVKSSSSHTRGG